MRGSRPFWFEAAWINHLIYMDVVSNAWSKESNPTSALQRVQEDSIIFNRDVFRNIRKRKQSLENRIKGIQCALWRIDSGSLVILEQQLQKEYDQILAQEELLWFQKLLDKWIKFGDRSTQFFHIQTIIRRKRNKVNGLTLQMTFGATMMPFCKKKQ